MSLTPTRKVIVAAIVTEVALGAGLLLGPHSRPGWFFWLLHTPAFLIGGAVAERLRILVGNDVPALAFYFASGIAQFILLVCIFAMGAFIGRRRVYVRSDS
jgi:hypothetical protein